MWNTFVLHSSFRIPLARYQEGVYGSLWFLPYRETSMEESNLCCPFCGCVQTSPGLTYLLNDLKIWLETKAHSIYEGHPLKNWAPPLKSFKLAPSPRKWGKPLYIYLCKIFGHRKNNSIKWVEWKIVFSKTMVWLLCLRFYWQKKQIMICYRVSVRNMVLSICRNTCSILK